MIIPAVFRLNWQQKQLASMVLLVFPPHFIGAQRCRCWTNREEGKMIFCSISLKSKITIFHLQCFCSKKHTKRTKCSTEKTEIKEDLFNVRWRKRWAWFLVIFTYHEAFLNGCKFVIYRTTTEESISIRCQLLNMPLIAFISSEYQWLQVKEWKCQLTERSRWWCCGPVQTHICNIDASILSWMWVIKAKLSKMRTGVFNVTRFPLIWVS